MVREAQRTFTYLNLYGYLTDAVVVNRVFPDDVSGGYFSAWRDVQQRQLDFVEEAFAPVPVLRAPFFEQEVMGREMLERLSAEVFGERRAAELQYRDLSQELVMANGSAPSCACASVRREGRHRAEDRARDGRARRRTQAQHHPAIADGRLPAARGTVRGTSWRCASSARRPSPSRPEPARPRRRRRPRRGRLLRCSRVSRGSEWADEPPSDQLPASTSSSASSSARSAGQPTCACAPDEFQEHWHALQREGLLAARPCSTTTSSTSRRAARAR